MMEVRIIVSTGAILSGVGGSCVHLLLTQKAKWTSWQIPDGDPVRRNGADRMLLEVFLYLQVLDVISTLIGFSLGNTEASPFIRLLIRWGPVTGLIWSKLFAAGCLLLCILLNRWRLIRWINYWYAALVTWNLYSILRVLNS